MRDPASLQGAAIRAVSADPPDLLGYLFNDHGNAERMIALYGKDMKYCHAMKKWLVWDGRRWCVDETDQARRSAKQTMLEFLQQAVTKAAGEKVEKFARGCLDAHRVSSMLSMAECEIYALPNELDTLTGCTIEKAVFLLFGAGDNGKSTMLSTFRQLVDEYSVLLQVDTLMVRQESNNSQADLADLRGARFVQTSETEEGQRLAQGKLKRITQGMGKIKAVRKYENPIEFPETHKLWMDTNRKPTIRDADDRATFSRLHPIPFLVRIPREQIDRDKVAGGSGGHSRLGRPWREGLARIRADQAS